MPYNPDKPISIYWNQLALDAITYSSTPAPMAAHALAMVHTAMYDAWSVYQDNAISTSTGLYIKARKEHCSKENVRKAFSYAACRILTDLFRLSLPAENKNMFTDFMNELDYDPADNSLNIHTAAGVGNLVAKSIIEYRYADGSNPGGTLHMPAWSDYTGYKPVNPADHLHHISRWQPLKKESSPGIFSTQHFLVPHWGLIKPFALKYNHQFRPPAPYNEQDTEFIEQAKELLAVSACLTDEQKAMAEYWNDGPCTFSIAGHWCEIAQYVLRNEKRNTTCIKLFFALSNALLDASVACWDSKRHYDSARPVSVIRHLFAGEEVAAWAGPCERRQTIKGESWNSFIDTPPYACHVSLHSTLSFAAAAILKNFTGSDKFEGYCICEKGSSVVESKCKVPSVDIRLSWPTFSYAAEQAGVSRLYGGVQFRRSIMLGQELGTHIGVNTWKKVLHYFN